MPALFLQVAARKMPAVRAALFVLQGAQAASKNEHVDTLMDELHDTIQQLTQSKVRL